MSSKLKILLSNDDGVYAWGLRVLYKHLSRIGQVWVVAPLEEKSTTGHSLTIHKPLRVHKMESGFYGVNGSPADCVYIGIREVMRGMPDLVVSGINRGGNLGQDIYYSGTVSAAREACILGLPSIAVSVDIDYKKKKEEKEIHFDSAGKYVVKLIRESMKKDKGASTSSSSTSALYGIPKHTLLNVNVPDLPMNRIKGFSAAKQGFRYYSGTVIRRVDHRGKPYFWIGGQYKGYHNMKGTDCKAVADGYVSVTPVRLDCTDYGFLNLLERSLK